MISRRHFVAMTVFAAPGLLCAGPGRLAALPGALARLEAVNGGRLGVAVIDTATGERAGHRESERFPMCSTFKFLLAAAVLQKVDRSQMRLGRRVPIPPLPLLGHSPLTEPHAGDAMTVEALCEAVLTQSDNTAANALLALLGGPSGITRFARSIGDDVTRLDRTEPELNESRDHDPRDTTSPSAMADDLHKIVLGEVLSVALRDRVTDGMLRCVTGLDRLRARLPVGWRAADRTGTSGTHTSNDIGIFWPKDAPPVIVTAYITQCAGPETKRAAMLARVGELVMESLRQSPSSAGAGNRRCDRSRADRTGRRADDRMRLVVEVDPGDCVARPDRHLHGLKHEISDLHGHRRRGVRVPCGCKA